MSRAVAHLRGRAVGRRFGTAFVAAVISVGSALGAATQPGPGQAEALFVEAENLLRVGRVEQARDRYQRVVDAYAAAEFPDLEWRAAARVRLGDILWRSNAWALAGADYVAVLDEEPPSAWTSRARLGLAALSLGEGDWETAAEMFQRIVTAAETGARDANMAAADEARRRLTLIHRFRIRPLLGQPFWSSTRAIAPTGLELDRPVAAAAADDGQLLIIDEGAPAVLLIDSQHANYSRLAYNQHTRPWWGPDGLPYLPTKRAGVIALGGGRVGFLIDDGGRPVPLKNLAAGGRAPGGGWYLLDSSPRRVLSFGPGGEYEGQVTRDLEQPTDLAVDVAGRLHVLDRSGRAVIRFGPAGRRHGRVVSAPWRRPEAVEVDALGNIYVLDRDARTVEIFDEQGARIARVGPSLPGGVPLRGPRDIAVDGQGNLYIVDRGGSTVYMLR